MEKRAVDVLGRERGGDDTNGVWIKLRNLHRWDVYVQSRCDGVLQWTDGRDVPITDAVV